VVTQLALTTTLAALGYSQFNPDGTLSLRYVVMLSLIDTALLIGLIVAFLLAHGDRLKGLFLGSRPLVSEMKTGLALSLVALGMALGAMAAIRELAPWLRTVERNPLQDLVRTPGDAAWLAIVLVVAGGIREEIQRAFLLSRFERWLGGPLVGVVVISIGFGAGHYIQGADAAVVTAALGAFWAIVYLRRRSIVAPVVSHSVFNLLQLGQFLALGG
jgi:membrane protease YdiL (CAAX protease family)